MNSALVQTLDTLNPQDDKTTVWFRDWIYDRMGIHFPDAKITLLEQRLESLCVQLELDDISQLKVQIQEDTSKAMFNHMAHLATTNHTHFYRELLTLNFFMQRIVPSLPEDEKWRIWSAASSSGEELYTLALMIIKQFGVEGLKRKFNLLGTDINQHVIDKAEKGMYSIRSMEGVDLQTRSLWFKSVGLDCWQISNEIRENCLFRRFNLKVNPWPFSQLFHVTFLRNILYYFDKVHQKILLERIYEVTVSGGWLITSVTEPLIDLNVAWKKIDAGVYRKI